MSSMLQERLFNIGHHQLITPHKQMSNNQNQNINIDSGFETIEKWKDLNSPRLLKLHIGCGTKYLNGWCNIDAYPKQDTDTHRGIGCIKPDVWANILSLPTSNDTVDIIYSAHVVEHFYRHKAIHLFEELWRVLKPGGYVITEMPDLTRILLLLSFLRNPPRYPKEMNANRDIIKAQLYGAAWEYNDEGYQCHKYVWERKEFCAMLKNIGFDIILATGATSSHVPFRDMAVICMKPVNASSSAHSSATLAEALTSYGGRMHRAKKQLRSLLNLARLSLFQELN